MTNDVDVRAIAALSELHTAISGSLDGSLDLSRRIRAMADTDMSAMPRNMDAEALRAVSDAFESLARACANLGQVAAVNVSKQQSALASRIDALQHYGQA